ncbi:MAG TPA: phosphoenolpyruvate synthase [Candidatus Diapherotrites archaeon]|uniref:Phosphoenolpyruvate synthase n=1 Tax=Candidatus Iainarchaeum sp. TaxID=3101447 RepID=A0A7J4IYB9_9ARCH|nr:phosphoenolpyruvate synthase [Candidatus Diapherotrites archaeon]
MDKRFVMWFSELGIGDVPVVGGKNASLGEMYRELSSKGVMVPNGFALTAHAYRHFAEKTGLKARIRSELSGLNTHDMESLSQKGHNIRQMILKTQMPPEIEDEITRAYRKLERESRRSVDVAVRSSATAEDLPDASFAGQQETYLNIRGADDVINACKRCFASLFTNRAISYRHDKGFDHFSIALSVGVQKMVRSDIGCSGVMFTIDTETGFDKIVLINGAWGLGESVVQGSVNPDQFIVFKPTLQQGFKPILGKKLGEKAIKIVYSHGGTASTKTVHTSPAERREFTLSEAEILQLAKWAVLIEKHYSQKRKKYTPMDMEWAKDGNSGGLFIVQARPETVQSQKDRNILEHYSLKGKSKVLIEGEAIGEKIGTGIAHVIRDASKIGEFRKGEVLVTDTTDPDWEPIMKMASAIITERGGRTSHAAIVSRELGIPAVVGTGNATVVVKSGKAVTVCCAEGERGRVFDGILPFEVKKVNVLHLPQTHTKVMMNVGNPEQALEFASIPNDGVGLAREEFIVNSYVKVHPNALLQYDTLKDEGAKAQIRGLTAGYKDKRQFYIDKLAEGMAMISAAFYPNPVILRFSDFKTNEYANLIGGTQFEPKEENPMIGWRGASRYYDPKFRDAFALECEAVKKVRDGMGLANLKVMVPFCRTVEEGKKVIAEMAKNGLKQGKDGLEVYVMCEIPSNVILAEEFCKVFDGFSIGSNDLTQLTLGLDRDSGIVTHIANEKNEAVKRLISQVIKVARQHHRKIGICGQAPSDFPDFAEFLVEQGIDSISLNPDTVLKTRQVIAKKEKAMKAKAASAALR